ncbi:adenine deaminase [Tenuifilum osseticum]|uniref:adenine deaminase n=1 Tax=Tenuifilum osseticum TaxID=3374723 RepID=UPI0034E3A10F
MKSSNSISGKLVDPIGRRIVNAKIYFQDGVITQIDESLDAENVYIIPGFVDSHVHIESSLLVPTRFAQAAIKNGTVAVVADPHEVANVAGIEGVRFMIENARQSKLKFFYGAPSCVPASPVDECFEPFTSKEVAKLLDLPEVTHLAEMMNFPGVINGNTEVHSILSEAKARNKPIDGHAPGLSGENLTKYVSAGITTDHECFTLDEAKKKIELGMKVLIREGSAAKNFDALHPIIGQNPSMAMFCTDDCHPDELMGGHINKHVRKAIALGYDIFDVLQVASVNPVNHYRLNVGLLQVGQPADFIVVDNLKDFNVLSTYIKGVNVTNIEEDYAAEPPLFSFPNHFDHHKIKLDFPSGKPVKVIKVIEGELITETLKTSVPVSGYDFDKDILKIVVLSRYNPNNIGVGLIHGFGMRKGAIASSIAHDSHHIVAIGANDDSILRAIDYIIESRGGICYFDGNETMGLALPFFGLMTNVDVSDAAKEYSLINKKLKADGCKLHAPFMTMAFMSLSVIPHLKLTPAGLFDVDRFSLTSIFAE